MLGPKAGEDMRIVILIRDNHKCFFQSAFSIFLFYFIVNVVLVDLFCLRQNNGIIDYIATDTVDMA